MPYIKRKRLYVFIIYCSFIFSTKAFSLDAKNIVAYPVPFNTKIHQNLRIGFKPGVISYIVDKVKIEICDINGDTVFNGEYLTLDSVRWNGRNKKGKRVKPGLYIIKVSIENTGRGEYGSKIIRILITH